MLQVYPTWIAPLFNKFSALDDDTLRARIEALLARCGFASSGLFVMDGSKRSSHGNAYFTGFGRSKRIVFFDTLLARLQPAEPSLQLIEVIQQRLQVALVFDRRLHLGPVGGVAEDHPERVAALKESGAIR